MSCLALPTSDAAAVAVQTDRRRVSTRHILRLIHPLPVLLRVTTSSRDNITGGGGDFDVADRIDPFFPALHLPETFGIVPPLGGQRVSSSSLPYRGVNNFLHDNLTGSPGSGVQVGGETVIESFCVFFFFFFFSSRVPFPRPRRDFQLLEETEKFFAEFEEEQPGGCSVFCSRRKEGRKKLEEALPLSSRNYISGFFLSIYPSVCLSIYLLPRSPSRRKTNSPAGRPTREFEEISAPKVVHTQPR